MAIYGTVPSLEGLDGSAATATSAAQPTPPPEFQTSLATLNPSQTAASPVDIEAWTLAALNSLSVSPVARGTHEPSVNIDEPVERTIMTITTNAPSVQQPTIRRPLSRRDSQKTREALLKGKEGTRQRRRWENDRLVGVPNVQPPLPSDWEIHPTHRVQAVPYHKARHWDSGLRQHVEEKTLKLQAQCKKQQRKNGSATGLNIGEVPPDLRDQAKRAPAVKGWVRVLEEPVRNFLKQLNEESDAEGDSEDEEIIFVGRKGMSAAGKGWKKARREVGSEKVDNGMAFDSLGDDESASYKRWLTHTISDYYGLDSRSITAGNPQRRIVYVTMKKTSKSSGPRKHTVLPRPLWEMC